MRAAGPFVDESLTIGSFGPDDSLAAFVESQEGHFAHWTADEMDGLRGIADHAQDLLDTVERRCLVHSDLNPKNLLVDPESLEVTGLLDWEYAHAGHPFTDLGNLLRFDRQPAYVEAVLAAYGQRRGVPPDAALALGRAADLWALVDLAARRGSNPVADRAHDLLRAVAAARDLNAVPDRRRLDRRRGARVNSSLAPDVCWSPDRVDASSLSPHRLDVVAVALVIPMPRTVKSVVKQDVCACPHDICPPKESTPL